MQALPDNSPLAQKIQSTKKQWQNDWQQNQNYLQAAQKGLDEKRWQDAINAAKQVKENTFWLKQSKELIKQAELAIAAQSAPPKRYYSRTRTSPRSTTYPKPVYHRPIYPKNIVLPSPSIPNTSQSGSKSILCLNKNSRIPKCRK